MSTSKKPNMLRAALAAARNNDGVEDGELALASDPIPFATPQQEADDTETVEDDAPAVEAVENPAEPRRDESEVAAANPSNAAGHSPAETVYTNGFAPPERAVKMGRPSGKRSDPNYMQMTAYIPIDLHEDVKAMLLGINRDRRRQKLPQVEISDVVETQLLAWVQTQKGERPDF